MKPKPILPHVLARWYYDPGTKLFHRCTRKTEMRYALMCKWISEEQLPKTHRTKIGILQLGEVGDPPIPYVGRIKKSTVHSNILLFWLYKDVKK